jgi:hypothetical protein
MCAISRLHLAAVEQLTKPEASRTELKLLLNSLFIITLRAGAVPPGDSLEFPARRHGAGSRCQLRKAEEEREEVV